MSLRNLILGLMPARMRADAEAHSRRWIAACTACSKPFSIWDIGGVRYKATGRAKTSLVRCPQCGHAGLMRFERKT